MRIIATQFGVLFALLAFSSQLLSGSAFAIAATIGFMTGLAILASILLVDGAVDRFLMRKYGAPHAHGDDLPAVVQHGTSTPHSDGGAHKAA